MTLHFFESRSLIVNRFSDSQAKTALSRSSLFKVRYPEGLHSTTPKWEATKIGLASTTCRNENTGEVSAVNVRWYGVEHIKSILHDLWQTMSERALSLICSTNVFSFKQASRHVH
jgi:hypothetical protein